MATTNTINRLLVFEGCGSRTKGSQQTRDGEIVGSTSGLVLAHDTGTNTLNNTNLGGLLIIELAQTEGESAELLDNLRQRLARARALETVGSGGTAVQRGTVVEILDLTSSQAETNLNTPHLTHIRNTVAAYTIAGGQDDLLLALDLVAIEQPASGVLDDVAVVGLGDLLEEAGHVGLSWGLLGGRLLLLLLGALGQQTGRNHQTQQKLVSIVGCDNEVSLTASDNVLGSALGGNYNHVTDDGSEAINLSSQLDLDNLSSLQGRLGLGGVRDERSVGSDIGARRDSGRVRDTLTTI